MVVTGEMKLRARACVVIERRGATSSNGGEDHRAQAGAGPVRVAPTGLEHPDLDRRSHLVRAPGRTVGPVDEPSQPLVLVPTQPSVHRLA